MKIITVEEANKIITDVTSLRSVEVRPSSWYGLLTGTQDGFAYFETIANYDLSASLEKGYGLLRLSFVCGNRRMGQWMVYEMKDNANELLQIASATERLNDCFKDCLVKEEDDD